MNLERFLFSLKSLLVMTWLGVTEIMLLSPQFRETHAQVGCWREHRWVKAKILDKSKFWDLSAMNPARSTPSQWSSADSLPSSGRSSQSWCPLPRPPGVCVTSCCHSGLVPGPEWSPSSGHGILQGWAEQSAQDCPDGKGLDGLKGCYARTLWM